MSSAYTFEPKQSRRRGTTHVSMASILLIMGSMFIGVLPSSAAPPLKAVHVNGSVTAEESDTITITGTGFVGRPRITSNVPGLAASVIRDTGKQLTVVVNLFAKATSGVRIMTITLANGKRTSVYFRVIANNR